MRTCYYELLGVERKAEPSELKKAYRRKALELHPDKNMDRIDEATELFAQIQEAYEILSDVQERAWYDSHREAILRGDDDPGGTDAGANPAAYMDITTTDVLLRFFSASAYKGFTDAQNGFFGFYAALFRRLEEEEEEAARQDTEALADNDADLFDTRKNFGSSNDHYDGQPKEFYAKFLNFSSVKSYRWHDKYRLSEAPDRRVRRLMEKDNKRAREVARREFNETVRSLAAFLRKRDPRYKGYQEAQKQAAAVRLAEDQKKRANETRRERERRAEDYVIPEWAKVKEADRKLVIDAAEEVEIIEELFCAACNKAFRSENQFENHEKSKKHTRNVELLREQLLEEDGEWGDESFKNDIPDSDASGDSDYVLARNEFTLMKSVNVSEDEDDSPTMAGSLPQEQVVEESDSPPKAHDQPRAEELLTDRDEPTRRAPRTRRRKQKQTRFGHAFTDEDPVASVPSEAPSEPSDPVTEGISDTPTPIAGRKSAKEKRAAREAKKIATAEAAKSGGELPICHVCAEGFSSRSKLFDHIKETGHALAVPLPVPVAATSGSKGSKGKGKKA
ncbi:hypothetical protein HKX48_001126 [Thoreauomyces humboldtii]|nr:hypothetical protein HKX48_001126 [Thoreauomyces humboldtii]